MGEKEKMERTCFSDESGEHQVKSHLIYFKLNCDIQDKTLIFGMPLNKCTVHSHLELYFDLVLHPPKSIGKLRKIQGKATEVIRDMEQ